MSPSQQIADSIAQEPQRFLGYLRSKVGIDLAADIFQDALIKAMESAGPADEDKTHAWFTRIMKNTLMDYFRRTKRERINHERLAAEADILATNQELSHALACDCLLWFLNQLPQDQSTLIERLDLNEEDPQTVSEDLGISRGNLRVRHHRARKNLKEQILKVCRCFIDADQECLCPSYAQS